MPKNEMQGSNVESQGVAAELERAGDATPKSRPTKRFGFKIRTNVKAGGFEWT